MRRLQYRFCGNWDLVIAELQNWGQVPINLVQINWNLTPILGT